MTASEDEGFTLVEMLVTLAIIGVVFALLSSVIGFGRDVLGMTTNISARIDDVALTKRLLVDTLSEVVVTNQAGLLGGHNNLSTVAFAPQSLGLVAPTETIFGPGSDGHGLQVKWTDADNGKGVVRRVLSAESAVVFSYFSANRGWAADWTTPEFLPDLVRVQISGDLKSPLTEFTIAVKRLNPPSCLIRNPGHCPALK